jgi:cytochrome c-type biogenesis protein CcsB
VHYIRQLPAVIILLLILILASATFPERSKGAEWAYENIYGTRWFAGLWGAVAVAIIAGMVWGRLYRNLPVLLLHFSFLLILAGALCTKLFAVQGYAVLHTGRTCEEMQAGKALLPLPFALEPDTFYVEYYPGTDAPSDYVSHFSICDLSSGTVTKGIVSMNRIFTCEGFRFSQSSFEEDLKTSVLSVNRDVWGIPVTYAGYALFVVSMIWFLLSPRNAFRRLLSHPAMKKAMVALLLLCPASLAAGVLTGDSLSVGKQCAADFGRLWMLYNGRISPVAVFAHDFTLKISGKTSFGYLDANQFLAGFLFFPDKWQRVALFDVKNPELKKLLNAETEKAAWMDFYDSQGRYKLDGYRKTSAPNTPPSSVRKEAEKLNDKIQLINMLHSGSLLRIYPVASGKRIQWFHPTQDLPEDVEEGNLRMIRSSLLLYYRSIVSDNEKAATETLRMIGDFQRQNAGRYLPSDTRREVELFYVKYNFTALLFKTNLTLGILALLFAFLSGRHIGKIRGLLYILLVAGLLVHTLSIALRTYISGRLPFGNGYETMLLIAWCAMFIAVLSGRTAGRRNGVSLHVPFGFLLSGCSLLVAWLSMKNPQITPLVPVLSSPLLSIHVSTIMLAYTLLGFMTLNSLTAIFRAIFAGKRKRPSLLPYLERQRIYGLVCLYPALLFLGAGIFLGAVWANVSWGRYWGWDPKEVWALITFLVYSLIIHRQPWNIPANPLRFHVFSVLSFLTVLMTYFGVNYFLGGMHSYGG